MVRQSTVAAAERPRDETRRYQTTVVRKEIRPGAKIGEVEWQIHRLDWINDRLTQRSERHSPGKFFIEPVSEETALVRQVTGWGRSRREGAAAALHGRNLSAQSARALVWQLRHRNPAYREAARTALWESTITDEWAVLVLAGQLQHPNPELREVAQQVLRDTKISTDADVME